MEIKRYMCDLWQRRQLHLCTLSMIFYCKYVLRASDLSDLGDIRPIPTIVLSIEKSSTSVWYSVLWYGVANPNAFSSKHVAGSHLKEGSERDGWLNIHLRCDEN